MDIHAVPHTQGENNTEDRRKVKLYFFLAAHSRMVDVLVQDTLFKWQQ